ncbi:MAG: NAD(P)-dependent alcohol dehydrogenase [Actinomycetota bacterium]
MRALVQDEYGDPAEVLRVEEVDRPEPRADEVLVRVEAASVNPADWHLVRGEPLVARMAMGLGAPRQRTPGCDVAGVVEAVGASVTRFGPGDAVFGSPFGQGLGAFAEYVAVPDDQLALRPTEVSAEQAAAGPLAALTALQGLRDHGGVTEGRRVLIIGASGGVGGFAVQLAKHLGATVTGVCSRRNLDRVSSLGADHVVDYAIEDAVDGALRYDVILQLAGERSPTDYRRALTSTGTLVMIGGDSSDRVLGAVGRLAKAAVLSLFISQRMTSFTVAPNRDDLQLIADLLADGTLVPTIERTYELEEVPEAILHVEAGHTAGKVVVRV